MPPLMKRDGAVLYETGDAVMIPEFPLYLRNAWDGDF
jgi:hypothetical protein